MPSRISVSQAGSLGTSRVALYGPALGQGMGGPCAPPAARGREQPIMKAPAVPVGLRWSWRVRRAGPAVSGRSGHRLLRPCRPSGESVRSGDPRLGIGGKSRRSHNDVTSFLFYKLLIIYNERDQSYSSRTLGWNRKGPLRPRDGLRGRCRRASRSQRSGLELHRDSLGRCRILPTQGIWPPPGS